jgi:hypothetical protein
LTSFLLIRYKLEQAKHAEEKAEKKTQEVKHPAHEPERDLEKGNILEETRSQDPESMLRAASSSGNTLDRQNTAIDSTTPEADDHEHPPKRPSLPKHVSEPPVFSTDPHLEQVTVFGHS